MASEKDLGLATVSISAARASRLRTRRRENHDQLTGRQVPLRQHRSDPSRPSASVTSLDHDPVMTWHDYVAADPATHGIRMLPNGQMAHAGANADGSFRVTPLSAAPPGAEALRHMTITWLGRRVPLRQGTLGLAPASGRQPKDHTNISALECHRDDPEHRPREPRSASPRRR